MMDLRGEITSTVLVKATASWNEIRYEDYPDGQPELTTVHMTIPPRSKLPWHRHLMPSVAYIVAGQLTIEERDTGLKATYVAGQAFAESVGSVHRGVTGSAPAVVVVTYAGSRGQPLSVPVAHAPGLADDSQV